MEAKGPGYLYIKIIILGPQDIEFEAIKQLMNACIYSEKPFYCSAIKWPRIKKPRLLVVGSDSTHHLGVNRPHFRPIGSRRILRIVRERFIAIS